MTGPKKGSRGRVPKSQRNHARSRDGSTRETSQPKRELPGLNDESNVRNVNRKSKHHKTSNPAKHKSEERNGPAKGPASSSHKRKSPPKIGKKKSLPELKRVQLDAPPTSTVFKDRDGQSHTFPQSNLKRVAAHVLSQRNKPWRYRAFPFPIFNDKGNEQTLHFDFYIYDSEDSVIRLIMVIPYESREVWDKIGRFKRQYPMYNYELWTPERLGQLQHPRARLGF